MRFKTIKKKHNKDSVTTLIIEAENLEEAKKKADLCCRSSNEYIESVTVMV